MFLFIKCRFTIFTTSREEKKELSSFEIDRVLLFLEKKRKLP